MFYVMYLGAIISGIRVTTSTIVCLRDSHNTLFHSSLHDLVLDAEKKQSHG